MESTEIAKLFDAIWNEPRGHCFYFEMNERTFAHIVSKSSYKFRFNEETIEARPFTSKPRFHNIIYQAFKDQKKYFGSIWFSHHTSAPMGLMQAADEGTGSFIVFENDYLSDGKTILRRFMSSRR